MEGDAKLKQSGGERDVCGCSFGLGSFHRPVSFGPSRSSIFLSLLNVPVCFVFIRCFYYLVFWLVMH